MDVGRAIQSAKASLPAWQGWAATSRYIVRCRPRDNRAFRPARLENADEVRCAGNAVRSWARLGWLHPELQRNSRVVCAERGLDTTQAKLHGLVRNVVEDLLGLAPGRVHFRRP